MIVLEAYKRKLSPVPEFHVVEPLTATGVRAVRYAVESPPGGKILAGDIDECAVLLAKANAKLNNVNEKVTVKQGDAGILLLNSPNILGRAPLYIDIDPFGSPAHYLQPAFHVIGIGGIVAATATDLAVLEGSKPRAAIRRYMSRILKVPESKEIGLRVLIAYSARVAASMDKWIKPLLAYYADHYYRVYFQVGRGAKKADSMLEREIGTAYYCPLEKRTYLTDSPPACKRSAQPIEIGPIWRGNLNDINFILNIKSILNEFNYLETMDRIQRLIEKLECEASLENKLHLKVEQAASYARSSMPSINTLMSKLASKGYKVCRSHYGPTSIRTNAPYSEVVRLILTS